MSRRTRASASGCRGRLTRRRPHDRARGGGRCSEAAPRTTRRANCGSGVTTEPASEPSPSDMRSRRSVADRLGGAEIAPLAHSQSAPVICQIAKKMYSMARRSPPLGTRYSALGTKPRRAFWAGLVLGLGSARPPGRPVVAERRSASSARNAGPLSPCRDGPLGMLPLEQPGRSRAAPPVREKLGRQSGISGREAAPCVH